MTEAAERPALRVERQGMALWVCIDREERRNALNPEVIAGFTEAVRRAGADTSIRALVLTGAGDRAFCAGADLTAGAASFQAAPDEPTTDFGRLARLVRDCPVPIIARVNGACVAGGMGLMALCDMAIAADHARFGLPEARVGVFPMQVLVFLRAMIGSRHLTELCLTGELISAARAAEIGLINRVVPARDLDAAVEGLLMTLSAASPLAIKRGKQVMFAMEMMAFPEAMAFAEAQIALASRSSDAEEGLSAFNAKRPPHWATKS